MLFLAILKNSRIFSKNQSTFFQKKHKFWTFWGTLLFQLHPTPKFYLWRFLKKSIVSSTNPYSSFNKTDFWTFWEALFSQSHFTASLLSLAIFWKKSMFFFQKTRHRFSSKNQNLKRFENFNNSVAFYSISDKITVFWKKITVFSKNPDFSNGKTRFWTLGKSWNFQSHFFSKFANFSAFWKDNFFLKTDLCFFKKIPNFERLENSYSFSRIVHQNCYL